jgi:hypothetical protein
MKINRDQVRAAVAQQERDRLEQELEDGAVVVEQQGFLGAEDETTACEEVATTPQDEAVPAMIQDGVEASDNGLVVTDAVVSSVEQCDDVEVDTGTTDVSLEQENHITDLECKLITCEPTTALHEDTFAQIPMAQDTVTEFSVQPVVTDLEPTALSTLPVAVQEDQESLLAVVRQEQEVNSTVEPTASVSAEPEPALEYEPHIASEITESPVAENLPVPPSIDLNGQKETTKIFSSPPRVQAHADTATTASGTLLSAWATPFNRGCCLGSNITFFFLPRLQCQSCLPSSIASPPTVDGSFKVCDAYFYIRASSVTSHTFH